MKRLLWCAIVLLSGLQARAADKPTVIRENGKTLEAVWTDGSLARAFLYKSAPIRIEIPFQVTENSCNNSGIGQKFTFRPGIALPVLSWRWIRNPDASKIDRPLLVSLDALSAGSGFVDPSLSAGLPADTLEFTDVNWIPGMEDGVLRSFSLDAWNSESMFRNSQTGTIENRIVSGEIGMTLSKTDDHTAQIVHSKNGGFFEQGLEAEFLVGDVVDWSFLVNGQRCQISFKPDVLSAQDVINKYASDILGGKIQIDWTPYVWGQDKLPLVVPSFFEGYIERASE